MRFEPFDRQEVKVIGRLVEQKDFRLRRQHPHERRPPRLAAREIRRLRGKLESEFGHHRARRIFVVLLPKTGEHVVERRGIPGEIGFLRQIGEPGRRLRESRSAVGRQLAGGNSQQGGFPRPVATDQRDPLAGRNRQLGSLQQRRAAECQDDIAQLQNGRHQTRSRRVSASRDRLFACTRVNGCPASSSRRRVSPASQRLVGGSTRGDRTLRTRA